MSYPAGVTPINCRAGKSVLAVDGDATSLTVKVTPVVLGVKRLTYAPTGDQVSLFTKEFKVDSGETVDFQLIPTDHPDLIDGAGNEVTGWSYKVEMTQNYGRTSLKLDPVFFSPLVSQVGVIDVDLLPDGSVAIPELGNVPAVTSVLGETGAVTAEDLADPLFAAMEADLTAKIGEGLDEGVPPLVTDLLTNSTTVQDLIEGAAAGLDFALGSQFVGDTAVDNTLFAYPNNTRPTPGTLSTVKAIDPASYPASTNLNGQTVSTGTGAITTRFGSGTSGVLTTDATATGMRATGGALSPVVGSVDVGTVTGVSRMKVKALNAIGTAQGFGVFLAGHFISGDVRMLRVSLSGTSGVYVLQKWSGTGFATATSTTLLATSRVAAVNDVVDLELMSGGRLRLYVNDQLVASYTLSAPDLAAFADPTFTIAGFFSAPTSPASPLMGKWTWLTRSVIPETRKMVTVGPDFALPKEVQAKLPGAVYDIRDYDAKCDGILLKDAVAMSGAATVSSVARPFVAGDIGKTIAVMGAGPSVANANDKVWISTIASVASGVATLTSNATTSVAGARCIFGTPDDQAVADAQTAADAAGGGTVYFPAARTIVTRPLVVKSYVSWAGKNRELSWVHVIMDRSGTPSNAGVTDWLTCAGRTEADPLIGATFSNFGIEAEAMIHTEGYGSAIKPLNIYYVQRCSIERMTLRNTPATAIPFDHSFDQCWILNNLIINPGRLAPSGVGPGGSGIGAGTKGAGATEPTLIMGNVIIGTHSSAAAGPGHNGIFVEGQTGANPDLGTNGYKIIANTIIGMPMGISDTGSTGTLVDGNTIIGCGRGVRISKTSLPSSYPGLHTMVLNNLIRGCTGPGATDGIGVTIFTASFEAESTREYLHTIITGNQIIENKSWGVSVSAANALASSITGVMVHGNQIRANGLSGVRLAASAPGKLRQISVKDNQIVSNGKSATSGDQAGILVVSGTTLQGGRIQDNDVYDLATVPTQVSVISDVDGALAAGSVRRAGNTGDA